MRYHRGMKTPLPSADQVAERLRPLKTRELRGLASRSGVPYRTLLKIRIGETPNPGLETVRKFFHLLPDASGVSETAAVQATTEQGVANA